MNEQAFGFCSPASLPVTTDLSIAYVTEGLQTACDRFPKAGNNGIYLAVGR
jgi:hypothetical protein